MDMYNRCCCCCCCIIIFLFLSDRTLLLPAMRLNDDFNCFVPHDDHDDDNRYIMGRSAHVNLNDILPGLGFGFAQGEGERMTLIWRAFGGQFNWYIIVVIHPLWGESNNNHLLSLSATPPHRHHLYLET